MYQTRLIAKQITFSSDHVIVDICHVYIEEEEIM